MIGSLQTLHHRGTEEHRGTTFNAEIAEIAEWFDRFDAAPRSGGVRLRGSEYKPCGFASGLYFLSLAT
jgi:hypothetical protein